MLDRQSRTVSAQDIMAATDPLWQLASCDSPSSHSQRLELFLNEVVGKKYELKLSKLALSLVQSWGPSSQPSESSRTIWQGDIIVHELILIYSSY
jgi:hypothetical protein